nr:MAG TPA: hypothetical protein [Caudoviricetes sp.]
MVEHSGVKMMFFLILLYSLNLYFIYIFYYFFL